MQWSNITTDLDGSGQIVAVADSGLDHDHGDFEIELLAMSMLSEMALQQMLIPGTVHTLPVRFLEMELEEIMLELLLKRNYISKLWRMITTEISNGPASTIC